jgi:hypothetical protein
MKKFGIIVLSSLILIVFTASSAFAQHFQSDEPTCDVSGTTVTCTGSDIAGLGNDNVRAELLATYSGRVECTNHGGQLVEAQETTFDVESDSGVLRSKNGRVLVPELSVSGPTSLTPAQERALCPNPNWDASLEDVELESWSYTIYTVSRRTGETVFFSLSG